MSVLLISQILGLFVNIFTADDKYSLRNKSFFATNSNAIIFLKIYFSEFFASFLKCISNFEHFLEKDDPHRLHLSEISDCERRGYLTV